jgi:hypothetical protein
MSSTIDGHGSARISADIADREHHGALMLQEVGDTALSVLVDEDTDLSDLSRHRLTNLLRSSREVCAGRSARAEQFREVAVEMSRLATQLDELAAARGDAEGGTP